MLCTRLQQHLQASPPHGSLCRGTGRAAVHIEQHERRKRAVVEPSGEGGAAGVGDLGVVEDEHLELRQPCSRRRQRTCRRRRRHEGGEALVAERIVAEVELLQSGQPPQGQREGQQPRVTDGGVAQVEALEPRQGASAQGGSERRGAGVAHMHSTDSKVGHGRQRTRAQPLRQPLHAAVAS
eukprot:scaffold51448_cov64-Phaeocystis_antarctica.AAC.10